jgi:UDP-glucuronate 4-epimerase
VGHGLDALAETPRVVDPALTVRDTIRARMRALVTGGAGFIGSNLVDRLLADGWQVTALDNFDPYYDPAQKHRNVARALGHPAYRLLGGDVQDLALLAAAFDAAKPDVVVHLAACAGVRASVEDPVRYLLTNELGGLHVLETCRRRGNTPLVFASTSSVYGRAARAPFEESDAAMCPLSPYAASKRAAELMVHAYHHLHRLPVAVLRFFTVYGPRGRPDMAPWIFTEALLRGRTIRLHGTDTKRDFTYVDDIVAGVVRAVDWVLRERSFGTFNLGCSEPVVVRRLIDLLARELGRTAEIEIVGLGDSESQVTAADVSRARDTFGYEPRVRLDEGVRRWVRWVRECPEAPPELRA